ncbi:metallophosphoesterase [Reichenbachiella agarivorans]|uniref:Metallophosphoesterase n=1 Tax=Reichenbachiella agarivorans TaxID=2979464 RepID=A0ABY6CSF8_9BACT|nr:BamA/TamA family outer membrane protein [Reichenbachiella agarivorans]UXP33452.1 metallophosphoesterase [Reichenbachiella agarivorans]
MMKRYLVVLFLLLSVHLYGQNQPDSNHTIFLIGDAGEPSRARPNLKVLKGQLEAAGKDATLIFLGDNIYTDGLPPKDHPRRQEQEAKLTEQFEITQKFKGRTIVIPGNHDWDNSHRKGWQHVHEQTKFVKDYFDSKKVFYPKDGFPGPEEIKLDKGVYLIVFDMQWMLHRYNKPLLDDPLNYNEPLDIVADIATLLEKHKNDHVILTSHHPLYSYGPHGGHFSAKEHLFPLTELNENLYIPLPLIGSLYPSYRATAGSLQDIPHPEYQAIKNALESLLKNYSNTIYVSGHEHALEHIIKDSVNYVVSGSGSKATYLKENGKYLEFGRSRIGFGKVNYSPQGQADLEFWAVDEEAPTGEKIYEKRLYDFRFIDDGYDKIPVYTGERETKKAQASTLYIASKGKRKWMGDNYRDVWEMEVEAPVFNLSTEKGGLEIIKKGGGMQTSSLRLEAEDGKQYSLRSVEKYADRALPRMLKATLAENVVQDQISASHPYAAYVVPPMADALGIYHTNPRLVYVPDDGAFGQYREMFANHLALFEERPNDDWSEAKFFGNSSEIIGSPDLFEALRDDNDNRVDEDFLLRNRMFDMIIGDWDRHEDQWRWASYDSESGKGKTYKAIPRDRDQVFFINDGILPKLASSKWGMPKIEGFNPEMKWAPGFNFNSRHLDRFYLTSLDRADWEDMIKVVQDSLTDEVIEDAIHIWPENVFAASGQRTIDVLKARRDNLGDYGMEFYESLAKEVEILCSDKKELILIQNLDKDRVKVTIHKISKKEEVEQVIYDRTFTNDDTKEVRIYAFDSDDEIKISGEVHSAIKVRVIGGKGKDEIYDETTHHAAKNVLIYDRKSTNLKTDQQSFKSKLSDRSDINDYNRYSYEYDLLVPIIYGSFNPDDGVFVGVGYQYTRHAWRREPYASKHLLMADVAVATGAFNVNYKGNYMDVLGKWNVFTQLELSQPVVNNFFGIGNESVYDLDEGIDYYRTRIKDDILRVALTRELGNSGLFTVGSINRTVRVDENDNTYIDSPDFDEFDTSDLFDDQRFYSGAYAQVEFDTRDEKMFPTRGLLFETNYTAFAGLNDNTTDYAHFHTSLGLYYSFSYPAIVTLASRTGYAHNFGQFVNGEFYNANTLGGRTNLRGFRRTRFYGRTSFYQNTDLRIKLKDFSSFLFPGKFGVHGFYDVGRVWVGSEDSNKWHSALGAGVWVAPLSKFSMALSYAFSPEEDLISFDFGFFF